MTSFLFVFIFFIIKTTICYDGNEIENYDKSFFSDFLENFDENYAELNKLNDLKFRESIAKCSISYSNSTNKNLQAKTFKQLCASANPYLDEDPGTLSGKLFLYDQNIIGLVTNTELSVRFFSFNPVQKSLNQIYKKVFVDKVPYAACVDKSKNIFLVFPDEQKIGKYILETPTTSNGSPRNKILKEVLIREEIDYNPSSISCYDDNIYVSERPSNILKIYDKNLNPIKDMEINGVVISAHRSINVNQNARLFADDSSGIAFFNPIRHSEDFISYACHFYYKRNCIEDVFSLAENKNRTFIYIADSCDSEVKQMIYSNNGNVVLVNSYAVEGIPTSVLATDNGYLFVLSTVPPRIHIYYPRDCKTQNAWVRRYIN